MNSRFRQILILLMILILFASCAACSGKTDVPINTQTKDGTQPHTDATSLNSTPKETQTSPIQSDSLAAYDGVVEHIFFHPVIAYPEMTFDGDAQEKGFDDWMLTVTEYNRILDTLYKNNYIMVDINTVWSENVASTGETRMVRNTLMLPKGKKPIIISFDDVNYYDYMRQNGFPYKLILGEDGELWSWGLDPSGKEVISQDLDAITILEKFVRQHPDFSWNGAMGCIGLTGYEGILGYRTQTNSNDASAVHEKTRQKEIEAVKPIIAKLKSNGWTFASHSWGHIRLESRKLASVKADTQRWLNEVGSLIGNTQVYFYPYGSRPDGSDVKKTGPCFQYLQSQGFRIFASVGIEPYSKIKTGISAVICDRMHPDGSTLRWKRDRYLHLFDAWKVIDLETRPNRPYDRAPS